MTQWEKVPALRLASTGTMCVEEQSNHYKLCSSHVHCSMCTLTLTQNKYLKSVAKVLKVMLKAVILRK